LVFGGVEGKRVGEGTAGMPTDTPTQEDGGQANWRTLAAEARACAAEMAEPRARRIMQDIAAAYESLAQRANARKNRLDDGASD